ncbi:MAG: RNA polymerase sigma factor [Candidatus Gracilibacteria bacterium]|nr:RNA polymerase sigma factor [Candidatus Gracilibacteria bacterium]
MPEQSVSAMPFLMTFDDYYHDYKKKVYNFFFYRLDRDSALVDDLTSDTFIKAFEKFESYDDTYAFSTWIYTIARNTMIDYFRRHKKTTSIETMNEKGIEIEDEDSTDFENKLSAEMSVEQVKEVLDTLPALQRECIVLKYLEDMETSQIADIMGESEGNVRQSISRGMKRLRKNAPLVYLFILFFL